MQHYYYRVTDKKTGQRLYEGTSEELVKKGYFKSPKDISSRYAAFLKAKNPRIIFEREDVERPRKERKQESRYMQRRNMIVYTCYDAAGNELGHGTAKELVAQGIFGCEGTVHDTYKLRGGQNKPRGVSRMTRRLEVQMVETHKPLPTGTRKAAAKPAPEGAFRYRISDPDPIQRDIRDLMVYNAKAKKLGRPELDYGYWAAKGKPARP